METPPRDRRAERRAETALEQRARTRAAILEATFDVIGHPHGRLARVEDIAKTAKIARPTFYTYFSSMEELFAALSYELSQNFNFTALSYGKSLRNPAEEAATAIRYYLAKAASDQRWGWSMVNLSLGGPIFGAETFNAAEATVKWGIQTGDFTLTDVRLGRDMILGTGLAAMKTILTSECDPSYPERVACQVLIGLGVAQSTAEKLSTAPISVVIDGPTLLTP